MKLETLKFMYNIIDDKIHNWRGMRISDNYRQHKQTRDELGKIIEDAEAQSVALRRLRRSELSRLPVSIPFDIEVE